MTSSQHHTSSTLDWKPRTAGWEIATVVLAKGDTAWDPSSTKRVIHGPASVLYTRAPDGGIDAIVEAC